MIDPYPIKPFTSPPRGTVELPGSKSITNRALLLAAQGSNRITLQNALFSRDTQIMISALQSLGFLLRADEVTGTITVQGRGGGIPAAEASINAGNAGTAARFLTAFLCLKKGGRYHLDGDPAMRQRPISGLLDALRQQGAEFAFRGQPGHFPFTLSTNGLAGGVIEVDAAASSQILSALLMTAPLAVKNTRLQLTGDTVSRPFIEMTVGMMRQFGYQISSHGNRFAIGAEQSPVLSESRYVIEPDATAASYFLALPLATGGRMTIQNLGKEKFLQGDIAFKDVLSQAGVSIHAESGNLVSESRKTPSKHNQGLRADFNAISDTFLTLAALAPLLEGKTRITGIGHTRGQETDRISAMAHELKKLGQEVAEEKDGLEIRPNRAALLEIARRGVSIETYEDHRIAMSFSILGCADILKNGQNWLKIGNPSCIEKTFPHFFKLLEGLRAP